MKKASHFWGAMKEYHKELKPFKCLYCGTISYGRADRKFCSADCKNKWHNEQTRTMRALRSKTITALGHNYNILSEALARGEMSIDLLTMEDRGFHPGYITGYLPRRYGPDSYRCFDICYCQSSSRIYRIRRESEY